MTNINIIILALVLLINEARSDCKLSVSEDFGIDAPLLLNTKSQNFIYPTLKNPKEILFASNYKITIFCPGGTVNILSVSTNNENLEISCIEDRKFKILNEIHEFKDIRCSKTPEISIRKTSECPNGNLIEIGFNFTTTIFIRTILLCYNSHLGRTSWAHSVIPTSIMDNEPKTGHHIFGEAEISKDFSIHNAYNGDEQRKMLQKIMNGDNSFVQKYMPRTGCKYFARTHLVSRADQFYAMQQISTYQYLNVAPIWQCINNGNWRIVELIARELALQGSHLDVYTGVLDTLKLAYSPSENRDIYLAENHINMPKVFVPKFIFKLIFSRLHKKAIVFVTINNPYLTQDNFSNDFKICKEYKPCTKMQQSFSSFGKGYTYCCLYDDFMNNRLSKSLGLPKLPFVTPFFV